MDRITLQHEQIQSRQSIKKSTRAFFNYLWGKKWLYLMLLPVVAYFTVFKYVPMGGLIIAFKDYNMFQGIIDSPWVGLNVFRKTFDNALFWSAAKNTIVLNLATLCVNFPLTILLSLMLNEVRSMKFKKLSQSLLYLPHFISWVVVAGIATNLFSLNGGNVNNILARFGFGPIPFLSEDAWWIFTYVISNVWKEIGWGTIIYLAALTGVDESLYESAYIDGANKMQRIVYITLPMIRSVIVIMLILSISRMMSIGLDAPLLLGNTKVMGVSEVISTYIYRIGILRAQYSDATAIGLFQSAINIFILVLADRFAKLIGEEGIL